MSSAPAYVSPAVLRWARESIGYGLEDAAEKIGVKVEKLEGAEGGEVHLTMRQAERAALTYERPLAALFVAEPPSEEPQEAQFRRLPGAPEPPWPPGVVALVRRVRERQDAAAELYELLEEDPLWPQARGFLEVHADNASARARELLGISVDEQSSWRDHAGYEPLRHWIDAVEDLGVLVMQGGPVSVEEMRGFASLHSSVPAIVINTKDDPRARVFTVLHELGHLYLATVGATPAVDAEAWCEQFAGEVLMPRDHLEETVASLDYLDPLRKLDAVALTFGVTPRAAVVRARREGLIESTEANEVHRQLDLRGPRSGEGGGNYYWTQIGRLGPAYSRLVFSALEQQAVTYAAASSLLDLKVSNFDKFRGYLERRTQPV